MDINILRIAVTVAGLVLFLALVMYCWSRRRAREYHDAAMLPFLDEPIGSSPSAQDNAPGARK